jgi:hypothetical protein
MEDTTRQDDQRGGLDRRMRLVRLAQCFTSASRLHYHYRWLETWTYMLQPYRPNRTPSSVSRDPFLPLMTSDHGANRPPAFATTPNPPIQMTCASGSTVVYALRKKFRPSVPVTTYCESINSPIVHLYPSLVALLSRHPPTAAS